MPVSIKMYEPKVSSEQEKHCLVLHGWASDSSALGQLRDQLRQLPQAAAWRFWDVSYDTSWTRFPQSARLIFDALQKQSYDFSHSIFIGYSMGGVVSRQLISLGFPCHALITSCSPHHGPVKWMPMPYQGLRSIAAWSHDLAALNRNPRDVAHRERYHFYAITYDDPLGHHEHDGMVPAHSALGLQLGPVAVRRKINLHYSRITTFNPHWRGMFPQFMTPAVEVAARLLAE
jgi:pimeloyl-ACP methyl ester carboxylesterase